MTIDTSLLEDAARRNFDLTSKSVRTRTHGLCTDYADGFRFSLKINSF